MALTTSRPMGGHDIAVIGSGIAGMSAAWLLAQAHRVSLYEKNQRLGGHANTVSVDTASGPVWVDTGFIVFNQATYPNLIALLAHLGVATTPSDMSFGVSLAGGRLEYSSVDVNAFLCGGRNLISPRFWSMTADLLRFYNEAPRHLAKGGDISLGEYLARNKYGAPFQRDHLLPQAAAIWSASMDEIGDYPISAFVRFFENHGLLQLKGRPAWRTIEGGSRRYVEKLTAGYADSVRPGAVSVRRDAQGAWVTDATGQTRRHDHVLIATHANEALALLADASAEERRLLGAFRYTRNRAVLHTDRSLMPRRQALWASWNYVGDHPDGGCVVSYWMNRLQPLACRENIFLTLNPRTEPRAETILFETCYDHPLFDSAAIGAQNQLWSLQGARNSWFCGAHFGSGFHEDGLQAGLAAAEQLGGVKRPWRLKHESNRILVAAAATPPQAIEAAA